MSAIICHDGVRIRSAVDRTLGAAFVRHCRKPACRPSPVARRRAKGAAAVLRGDKVITVRRRGVAALAEAARGLCVTAR